MFNFKINNNCSKLEQINALKKTLSLNNEAIDYIDNHISNIENILKLDPKDKNANYELNTSKYIEFSLNYLEKCYMDRLKALGIKNFKVGDNFD